MKSAPAVRHLILAAAAFAIFYGAAVWRGAARGAFRIDEAHKISESVYLRLLLEGDFANPLWASHIVDRANPPIGKYFLGAAILAAGGKLPAEASLARVSGADAFIPPVHPEVQSGPYLPLLEPARRGSLFISSLTAALLVFVTARYRDLLAAAVALLLYATNFLTLTFAATAVFDPLLTFLVFAAVCAVVPLWGEPSRAILVASAVACGISGALAFQTRFTGLAGFAVALLLAMVALRRQRKAAVLFAVVALPLFAIVTVAANPYYWAKIDALPAVPAELTANVSLVPRIASRFERQVSDLDVLLDRTAARGNRLDGPAAKLRFFSEVVGGDLPGVALILLSVVALFVPLLPRARNAKGETAREGEAPGSGLRAQYFFLVSGILLTAIVVLWLPLGWPRYLLVVVPPLAAMSGVAVSEIVTWATSRKERTR